MFVFDVCESDARLGVMRVGVDACLGVMRVGVDACLG